MQKWSIFLLFIAAYGCKTGGSASAVKVEDGSPVSGGDAIARSTVGVRPKQANGGYGLCSGTLIDPTHVITAGHCFDHDGAQAITKTEVFFGLSDQDSTTVAVSSWTQHPEYYVQGGRKGFNNVDIEVLTLSAPAPAGYQPVEMVQRSDAIKMGDTLIIAGFGLTDESSRPSKGTLNRGSVHVTRFKPLAPQFATDRFAEENKADAATCHGDSGGPVYLQVGDSLKLAGVISGSDVRNCSQGTHYAVDIRFVTDWIGRAMRGGDLEARSVLPLGQGPDGQMYPYCRGGNPGGGAVMGDQADLGGKCVWSKD